MNVFIVTWHPEPASFNSAMVSRAAEVLEGAGHAVQVSDLFAMNFQAASTRDNFTSVADADYFKPQTEELHASEHGSFALDITAELDKLEWCDVMIWQCPLWWFRLPAVRKGWVDRVFAMGRVYGGGKFYESGTQSGKRALLSITTGAPAAGYSAEGMNGDLPTLLIPIHRGMFHFVGFDVLEPHVVYAPASIGQDARIAELERFATRVVGLADEQPIDVPKP